MIVIVPDKIEALRQLKIVCQMNQVELQVRQTEKEDYLQWKIYS